MIANSGTPVSVTEGSFFQNKLVAKFTDPDNPGGGDCIVTGYVATVKWGDGGSDTGIVSCELDTHGIPTGTFDVTASRVNAPRGGGANNVYLDSGSYTITVSVSNASEEDASAAVNTDTAIVTDVDLSVVQDNSNDGSYTSVEGGSLAASVTFADTNAGFPNEGNAFDPGIKATIDWGDGSTQTVTPVAPPSTCTTCGDSFIVNASHVYDATKGTVTHWSLKVTATDDGNRSITDTLNVNVSDAALTAGTTPVTLSATATQSKTAVLGSFTDAAGAQAAAGDFTASINWGDNATSSGTVSATASGFNVSGTHTYASSGSKSITATVTDEEGKTVTLHTTATVAGVTLPTTGQPQPAQPAVPLIPLVLLGIGLIGIVGASTRLLMTRQR